MEAITGNEGRVLILDTANRSSLPFLDERAVVEVPCVVGRAGPIPDGGRRRAGSRARADGDDQGGRAHDDPRRARGLGRARRAGARPAPARPVRERRAAASSTQYASRHRELAGRFSLTVDVVCTGPVFLDLTFEGLDALPAPGEERFARDLHATPGGAAITAIGLARLGLRTAVAAPLGDDLRRASWCDASWRSRESCAPARRRAGRPSRPSSLSAASGRS